MSPAPRPVALVLRALGLGDLLVSVPALRALRRARPDHEVVLAAPEWLRPVVGLTGCVDTLLPVAGLEALPYAGPLDLAVNLHGRGPQSHALLDALAPGHRVGHAAPGWDGPVWVDDTVERVRWVAVLRHHGIDGDPADVGLARPELAGPAPPGAVVVHVGAAYGSRSWPAERFAAVVRALAVDHRVVLTGSAAERHRAESIARSAGLPDAANLAGCTDLVQLAALVAGAALVMSVDTGAAHLATAYATPSVVLFGPAPPSRWGPPPGGPHVVLTDERARRGDAFADEPDPALLGVGVDEVLTAAHRLLAGRPRD